MQRQNQGLMDLRGVYTVYIHRKQSEVQKKEKNTGQRKRAEDNIEQNEMWSNSIR